MNIRFGFTEEQALEHIKRASDNLLSMADLFGMVVTIEQKPLTPLRQGNYKSVVTVRPARPIVATDVNPQ